MGQPGKTGEEPQRQGDKQRQNGGLHRDDHPPEQKRKNVMQNPRQIHIPIPL
ncbi:MAG: hypothetical protein LBG24_08860 [Treponema sp.]|jgi:hypothetical protein|nr:hypothetical protein [Treponema sp.]